MAKDMTPTEARDAFAKFAASVGPEADTSVFLSGRHSKHALNATLRPLGYLKEARVTASGDNFHDLLNALESAWHSDRVEKRRQTVVNMAVAIIRITDERGECLDRYLRCEFSRQDVEDCGPDACVKANEMAGRGPFTISATTGLNAPAQFDDEAA